MPLDNYRCTAHSRQDPTGGAIEVELEMEREKEALHMHTVGLHHLLVFYYI